MELVLEESINFRPGHKYIVTDIVNWEDRLKIGIYVIDDCFHLLVGNHFGGWIKIAAA